MIIKYEYSGTIRQKGTCLLLASPLRADKFGQNFRCNPRRRIVPCVGVYSYPIGIFRNRERSPVAPSSMCLLSAGIRQISRQQRSNAARIGPLPRRYVKRSHGRTMHGLHTGKGSFRRLFTVLRSGRARGRTVEKWKVEEKGCGEGQTFQASERASKSSEQGKTRGQRRRLAASRSEYSSGGMRQ